jgi:excisionase family DNA binding protein
MMAHSTYLSVQEVAETLRISPESVRALIRRGELPALRIGPSRQILRIDSDDLQAYIAAHYTGSRRTST